MKILFNRFAPFCVGLLVVMVCLVAAAAEKRRVDVSSERVDYAVSGGGAVFSGNVIVSAGGLTVHAATLRVQPLGSGNRYEAFGNPLSFFCDDCGVAKISAAVGENLYYDATVGRLVGGVTICAGENCERGKLHADSGDWQREENILLLRGSPIKAYWQLDEAATAPISLQAEQIKYHLDSGDLLLSGGAQIWRDTGNISGEVISININTGALEADGGSERVRATFGE